MPNFLAVLMALISTFIQPARPDPIPPINNEAFINRGNQVSDLANSLNPSNNHPSGNSQNNQNNPFIFYNESFPGNRGLSHRPGFGPTGITAVQGPTGTTGVLGPTGITGPTGSSIQWFPAENIRSEMNMPHDLPQNALDHSRALQGASSGFPLPPGQNNSNQ